MKNICPKKKNIIHDVLIVINNKGKITEIF